MLKQPDIRPIEGDLYRLFRAYPYTWAAEGKTRRIIVPAGFVHDGTSAPRTAALLGIRQDGLERGASLVHDMMYRHGGALPDGVQHCHKDGVWTVQTGVQWTRKDADRLFARMLAEANVKSWRRRWSYRAVHWFGWLSWGGRSGCKLPKLDAATLTHCASCGTLMDADPDSLVELGFDMREGTAEELANAQEVGFDDLNQMQWGAPLDDASLRELEEKGEITTGAQAWCPACLERFHEDDPKGPIYFAD